MSKTVSFKDRITKGMVAVKSPTFNMGFSNVNIYASTGNLALNRRLSRDFNKGYLFGRSVVIAGEPGAGKSLHCAYVCAEAQREHNALIIWLDVEKASSEDWLAKTGIDMNNCVYLRIATISDAREALTAAMRVFKADRAEDTPDDRQPIVLVIDSYSGFMTESQYEKAEKGDSFADQGQLAKQTGDLLKAATHLADGIPLLVLGTVHLYTAQDAHGHSSQKMTGGVKARYMASYVVMVKPSKLRESKAYDSDVLGITSTFSIEKCRFAKPFENVEIDIPYDTGMDRYSGLFELMLEESIVRQVNQGWFAFTRADGTEVKFQSTQFIKKGYAQECVEMACDFQPLNPHEVTTGDAVLEIEVV